jgi:multidrug resistance efflux pump
LSPTVHPDSSTFDRPAGEPVALDGIAPQQQEIPRTAQQSFARVQDLADQTAQLAARLAITEQLAHEAADCPNRRRLIFHMLNRTAALCDYDRATAWSLVGRRPRLLGISGQARINRHSPTASQWANLLAARDDLGHTQHLTDDSWQGTQLNTWRSLAAQTDGLQAVWLPLPPGAGPELGLCFERWGEAGWLQSQTQALTSLACWYGLAWSAVRSTPAALRDWLARWKTVTLLGLLVGLVAALALVRLPLRIVAPCQVVPVEPLAVTAPLDGVIERVLVQPGQPVQAGAVLARYDSRAIRERRNIAAQQVQVVQAQLQQAQVGGFDDPADRAEIALLQNRLEQERARLALAEYQLGQATITAPQAGQVAIDDPTAWRGRPVMTGQRLLMLIDPQRTKLHIDLPTDDRIAFDHDRPVRIMLHAQPDRTFKAELSYIAPQTQTSDRGVVSFPAEAAWSNSWSSSPPRVGLSGTAVIYGQPVCLGYWLGRKPLAWLRTHLGW